MSSLNLPMNARWLLPFFCLSFSLRAAESCAPEALKLTAKSSRVEVLFYTGTCHYRNKQYKQSVVLWSELLEIKDIAADDVELRSDALNNLGYLLFFGHGVRADKKKALVYWTEAVGMGQIEAEFHLCHAYADWNEVTYDPVKAFPHCRKAKLVYQGIDQKTQDDQEIIRQIDRYLDGLSKK